MQASAARAVGSGRGRWLRARHPLCASPRGRPVCVCILTSYKDTVTLGQGRTRSLASPPSPAHVCLQTRPHPEVLG